MHSRIALMAPLLAALLVLPIACDDAGGDGGDGPTGTAPTISQLQLNPTTISVGVTTTLTGNFQLGDPDGDATVALIELDLPAGAGTQSLSDTPLQGVAGQQLVSVTLQVMLNVPVAGEYTLRIRVRDSANNLSNALETVVTAQ